MYTFHYEYMVTKYGRRVQLLATDTDSLIYEVQTDDLWAEFKADNFLFDFANFPTEHKCFNPANNKVLGKMKSETNEKPILEFVGLKAKMYSILVLDTFDAAGAPTFKHKHTAKGIQRAARDKLLHDEYLQQLTDPKENFIINRRFGSERHTVYSYEIRKRGLCAFDDKRYILDDKVHTLALGHYNTRHVVEQPEPIPEMVSSADLESMDEEPLVIEDEELAQLISEDVQPDDVEFAEN